MLFFEAKKAGVPYNEFWDMTFPELFWAIDMAKIADELSWKQTREIVAIIYNTNAPKGKKKTAQKLVPLSIDKPITAPKKVGDTALDFSDFKKLLDERNKFKEVDKKIVKSPNDIK